MNQSEIKSGVPRESHERSLTKQECCVCIPSDPEGYSKNDVQEISMKAFTLTAALVVFSIASSVQAGLFHKHNNCGCAAEPSCCDPVEASCCAPACCDNGCGNGNGCGVVADPSCCAPAGCGNACGNSCGDGCGCGSSCFKMPKFRCPKIRLPKFRCPKIRLPKCNFGCGSGCGSSCGSACAPSCCAPVAASCACPCN